MADFSEIWQQLDWLASISCSLLLKQLTLMTFNTFRGIILKSKLFV